MAAATATILARQPQQKSGEVKLAISSQAACLLPDQEFWLGQHDVEMLMLDG
jgi:hypothetical protein